VRALGREADEAAHIRTGKRGEEAAEFYLRKLGYVMVARNYRTPRHRSELDLIGWDRETLCFIEVKTRSTHGVAPAEAAVDSEKQRDLAAVARTYLRRVPSGTVVRGDVVSVYTDCDPPQITLFKNAFRVR